MPALSETREQVFIPPQVIPLTDFQKPFTETPKSFHPNETPIRSNFTATNIEFFAVSRGGVSEHILLLDWAEVHLNIDMFESMRNYLKAEGWKCLSNEEHELVAKAYGKVRMHYDLGTEGIGEYFDRQIKILTSQLYLRNTRWPEFTRTKIEGLSWSDLPPIIGAKYNARKELKQKFTS